MNNKTVWLAVAIDPERVERVYVLRKGGELASFMGAPYEVREARKWKSCAAALRWIERVDPRVYVGWAWAVWPVAETQIQGGKS